jgi:hypothetical protein
MQTLDGVVERIREAGAGGEAWILMELRTRFPGLGGTIVTQEGVAAALRIEYNQFPMAGHEMFIRHLVAKKLDDHFYRSGSYLFAHVPRPLGSISLGERDIREAYLYEWAVGHDCFPWVLSGSKEMIVLRDWNVCVERFAGAGLDLAYDTTDPDDARVSQNVVHQYVGSLHSGELCSLWKRIDFGFRSILFDYDRLSAFLRDHRTDLAATLRWERYEMLCLAVAYLRWRRYREPIGDYDLGRLVQLICDFRRSSLSHYTFAFGSARGEVSLTSGSETLLREA